MLSLLIFIVLSVSHLINGNFVEKYNKWQTLYDPTKIVHNFRTSDTWGFKYNSINQVGTPLTRANSSLPPHFNFFGTNVTFNTWFQSCWITGIIVLRADSITSGSVVHENYFLGNNVASKTVSWSIGKAIVGALTGVAINKGFINSINDTVKDYLPSFQYSAYANVTVYQLLTMSSGIFFNENPLNASSDINKFSLNMVQDFPLKQLLKIFPSFTTAGTTFNYISSDTQLLGLVIRKAVGTSLTKFARQYFWTAPEFGAMDFLKVGDEELAMGGMSTTLENYAKFGWLYLNRGKSFIDGHVILKQKWVDDSVRARFGGVFGFGYNWWIPAPIPTNNEFIAVGAFGQYLYVDTLSGVVVAISSANPFGSANPICSEVAFVTAFRTLSVYYDQ